LTPSLRPDRRAAIEAHRDDFPGSSGNPLVVIPIAGGESVVIAGFIREAPTGIWPACRIARRSVYVRDPRNLRWTPGEHVLNCGSKPSRWEC